MIRVRPVTQVNGITATITAVTITLVHMRCYALADDRTGVTQLICAPNAAATLGYAGELHVSLF